MLPGQAELVRNEFEDRDGSGLSQQDVPPTGRGDDPAAGLDDPNLFSHRQGPETVAPADL
jgi:hypothetical protein